MSQGQVYCLYQLGLTFAYGHGANKNGGNCVLANCDFNYYKLP